jgi:predicted secreted protein
MPNRSRFIAVPRHFVRLLAVAVAVLVAPVGPALAGDYARTEILGFSADGGHFAFEEYGIQDGSGFPYSNIYVIDTSQDSWVPGSPFRLRERIDDSQPLDLEDLLRETRARNRETARAVLEATGIDGRGDTVAHNPPTEKFADRYLMVASTVRESPDFGTPLDLRMSVFPLDAKSCPSGFGKTQGFRLTMTEGQDERLLNDDKSLPESRGCPLDYRIERLVTYRKSWNDTPYFAVLVLVESIGFEGKDGRYLAITGKL